MDDHLDSPQDEEEQPAHDGRLRSLLRPGHRWFGVVLFGLALGIGIVASVMWMHWHPSRSAPTAAGAPVPLDPTHRPLPTPMAGGSTSLPPPASLAPDAPQIVASPTPEASAAPDATANPPSVEDTSAAVTPPTSAEETPQAEEAPNPASSSDLEAQLVKRVQPSYPDEAMRAHEEGEVRLQISLDAHGNVTDVQVTGSSHSRLLDEAASNAVRGWEYRPALRGGVRVASTINETVDFRMEDRN
jgi:TonB family protein